MAQRGTGLVLKRLIDIAVAGTALLVLSPLLLLTALLVRVKLGSPVLFAQVRPGLHGQPFRMDRGHVTYDVQGLALLSLLVAPIENQLLGRIDFLPVADASVGNDLQQYIIFTRQALLDDGGQGLQIGLGVSGGVEIPQGKIVRIEGPGLADFALTQVANPHLYLFRPDPIAPKEATIGQIEGVATGQLGKARLLRVLLDGALQFLLIVGVVAGRWRARAAEHPQGKPDAQGIRIVGQGRDINFL